ncbi:hypothetical protein RI367_005482 [Sorochytrium milnesiophthora]
MAARPTTQAPLDGNGDHDELDAPFTTLQLSDDAMPTSFGSDFMDPPRLPDPPNIIVVADRRPSSAAPQDTGIARVSLDKAVSRSMPSLSSDDFKAPPATAADRRLSSKSSPTLPSMTSPKQSVLRVLGRASAGGSHVNTLNAVSKTRPRDLPPKDSKEDQKHLQQYQSMLKHAKRKEQRESAEQQKQRDARERELTKNAVVWQTQIINKWSAQRQSAKALDLIWKGLPPQVRPIVWTLAIGNECNITPDVYQLCCERAEEGVSSKVATQSGALRTLGIKETGALIAEDVSNTLPALSIFKDGGPYNQVAQRLLKAVACYRPDIGYVAGMSYLVAVLLLNVPEEDAFTCMCNILHKGCLVTLYRLDDDKVLSYWQVFRSLLHKHCPSLDNAFTMAGMNDPFILREWIMTMFASAFPIDMAHRVWDLYCIYGDVALFQAALGVLVHHQDALKQVAPNRLAHEIAQLPSKVDRFDDLVKSMRSISIAQDDFRNLCKMSGCL